MEDRIEDGDAIQITGERGTLKSSFLTKDIAGEKPSSLKITQSPLSLLFFISFRSFLFSKKLEIKPRRWRRNSNNRRKRKF
jgi:hypothetical protein